MIDKIVIYTLLVLMVLIICAGVAALITGSAMILSVNVYLAYSMVAVFIGWVAKGAILQMYDDLRSGWLWE